MSTNGGNGATQQSVVELCWLLPPFQPKLQCFGTELWKWRQDQALALVTLDDVA